MPMVTSTTDRATIPTQKLRNARSTLEQRDQHIKTRTVTPSSVRRRNNVNSSLTCPFCCAAHSDNTVLNMDVGEMTARLLILSEIEPRHAKPDSVIWRASKSPLLIVKGVKQD